MIELNKKIIPIFYNVTPGDVTLKTNLYVDALQALHSKMDIPELSCDGKRLLQEEHEQWKKTLQEVGKFIGQEVKDTGYGEFSKSIVKEVSNVLKLNEKTVTDHLVGMDSYVETMLNLLDLEVHDVRYVGIHGMGGIGKTTLAKVIFNQISRHFEYCSFLSDIRESSQSKGIEYLQKQLLNDLRCKSREISDSYEGIKRIMDISPNKKVLVILDDVNQKEQIDKLVGNSNCFALGSRIIVTSRDKRMLEFQDTLEWSKGVSTLEMQEMNFDQALRLFSRHAFGTNSPSLEYVDLAKEVVSVSGFLPLSLEIIGSLLRSKSKDVWQVKIKALGKVPHRDVQQKLMISYEALDRRTKQMFLDVACFLVKREQANAIYMWEACNLHPETGMEDLVSMSLVKIVDNKFWMHDHLVDLGRDITDSEDDMNPGKRSRLWRYDEVLGTLERREGSGKVEVICQSKHLYIPSTPPEFTDESFKILRNLRFLKLWANLVGDFAGLLANLRWLYWRDCPPHLKAKNLNLVNLVVLDLSHSDITGDWNGWTEIKIGKKLKVLDLSYCLRLKQSPDLSKYNSLEKLILEGCTDLIEIDSSIGKLRNLRHLNIRLCFSLPGLPDMLCSLENLEEILVKGLYRPFALPRDIGNLKSLANLELVGLAITELPASFSQLKKLKRLSLADCWAMDKLPDSLGDLTSLVELDISRTRIRELPAWMCRLKKLKRLVLKGCRALDKLPDALGDLMLLVELDISSTGIRELPESVGSLKELKVMRIQGNPIRESPHSMWILQKLEGLHVV